MSAMKSRPDIIVIPAKAGIHATVAMDPGLRRGDDGVCVGNSGLREEGRPGSMPLRTRNSPDEAVAGAGHTA